MGGCILSYSKDCRCSDYITAILDLNKRFTNFLRLQIPLDTNEVLLVKIFFDISSDEGMEYPDQLLPAKIKKNPDFLQYTLKIKHYVMDSIGCLDYESLHTAT